LILKFNHPLQRTHNVYYIHSNTQRFSYELKSLMLNTSGFTAN
jgi:hypothetical protein